MLFYKTTGGQYTWTHNDNWLSKEVDFCDWYGVTCDDEQNIIALSLPHNGLINRIPESLMELTSLQFIDLSYNIFETKIVPQICQLTNLKTLFLRNNNINFEIPSCMCQMELENVDVSQNSISGYLPNCEWSVKQLHAECNNIHHSIPDRFMNMEEIDVRCNEHFEDCESSQVLFPGAVICGENSCETECEYRDSVKDLCMNVYSNSKCGDYVAEDYLQQYLEARKAASSE